MLLIAVGDSEPTMCEVLVRIVAIVLEGRDPDARRARCENGIAPARWGKLIRSCWRDQ